MQSYFGFDCYDVALPVTSVISVSEALPITMPPKTSAAKRAPKGSKVPKAAPKLPGRRLRGKGKEDQEGVPSGSVPESEVDTAASSSAGADGGDQARLLTSLKYQVNAKKASPEHRQAAAKLLQEYQSADRKRKWQLLDALATKGLADLSWSHKTSETHAKKELQTEETISGMYTFQDFPVERFLCRVGGISCPGVVGRPSGRIGEVVWTQSQFRRTRQPRFMQIFLQDAHRNQRGC